MLPKPSGGIVLAMGDDLYLAAAVIVKVFNLPKCQFNFVLSGDITDEPQSHLARTRFTWAHIHL